jgi:hypothetical protein
MEVSIFPINSKVANISLNFIQYFAAVVLPDINLIGKERVNSVLGQIANMKQLNFGRNKEI